MMFFIRLNCFEKSFLKDNSSFWVTLYCGFKHYWAIFAILNKKWPTYDRRSYYTQQKMKKTSTRGAV